MPGEKKQQVERVVIPEKGDKKIDEARSKYLTVAFPGLWFSNSCIFQASSYS